MQPNPNEAWLAPYLDAIFRFNVDIIGLPIPPMPTRLDPERKKWAFGALSEELAEFMDAETLEDEADALIDLSYFALGRLVEMGIVPGIVFEEVHDANMMKKRGELSKRPHSKGFDAIKPDGWTPPDLEPYLTLTKTTLEQVVANAEEAIAVPRADGTDSPEATGKPRVIIIGEGRHGKDTVAEIMRDEYGFGFTSSSMFCAEKVIFHALNHTGEALQRHFDAGSPGMSVESLGDELDMMVEKMYPDAEACFNDRANFRTAWFSLIAGYLHEDRAALGREIFETNDVYVGIRHPREFHAVVNAGLADLILWVDASERLPAEGAGSMQLEQWMANFTIDNNGTPDELRNNVVTLLSTLGIKGLDE